MAAAGPYPARLRFTTESPEECVRVLRAYQGRSDYRPQELTRGLFYRGGGISPFQDS